MEKLVNEFLTAFANAKPENARDVAMAYVEMAYQEGWDAARLSYLYEEKRAV